MHGVVLKGWDSSLNYNQQVGMDYWELSYDGFDIVELCKHYSAINKFNSFSLSIVIQLSCH
jgi:hypothetical protein